jgi:leucyl aminopeptidase
MQLRAIILLSIGVLVSVTLAVQKGDEFFTQPIRAKFDDNTIVWTTHAKARQQALDLGRRGVGYIDVTDVSHRSRPQRQTKFPTKPAHQKLVDPLLTQMSDENLLAYVTKLSSFPTRYYTSKSGVNAATWIKTQFETFAAGNENVDVKFFEHKWAQPSVIATLKGHGPLADEIVVIGAHEDSISFSGATAPGADDDGSGVSNVLEIFRVLVNSGIKFNRTIQFMTYSAEEVGLKGSSDIANTYYDANAKVFGVFQADMTAYVAPGKPQKINIIADYVNEDLTDFLKSLVPAYSTIPYVTSICDYACSDHASWYDVGYADVAVIEADPAGDIDPYIHSSEDTIDKLDFKFSLEYAKLGLGFLVEMALFTPESAPTSQF